MRGAEEVGRLQAALERLHRDRDDDRRAHATGLREVVRREPFDVLHEGIAEASDKGKPTLRRILATHEAVLDGVRKAQGAG